MAEAIISPGVFITENDLSQVPQGPIEVGAALIGPTVIGKVNVPTVVTSYAEYKQKFGSTFVSGNVILEYLTSIAASNYFEQGGSTLLVTRVPSGSSSQNFTPATASVRGVNSASVTSFTLETLSQGTLMNNNIGTVTNNGVLPSGSSVNVRWEIAQSDTSSGLFTLLIRRGDDYADNKTVLETWSNLSLDPNQTSYIAYVLGDQKESIAQDDSGAYYIQYSGSYENKSKYVRVSSVTATPGYLSTNGRAQSQYTASMPQVGSGSLHGAFGGATGNMIPVSTAPNMFENITSTNIQGIIGSDYNIAISLLSNVDAYRFNSVYAPGLNMIVSPTQVTNMILMSQNRGDNIAVVDMVGYGSSVTSVVSQASNIDSSYAATYWPWVQIRSKETGQLRFVPASTVVPAAYEYNDRISAEWFAPAGFNRGGMPSVLQPERRLSVNDRNSLYLGKVNPIATFSGIGTVIYGQKTLQAVPSALDRVNVRRLLIALKRFVGDVAAGLVFEPNTQATRTRFLSQVNPYLEYVQQRQGLFAFQVVMDETNNTPDTIDRNQLVGSIYLQPTRTAEFILLDFNILPTGVTFGQ